MSLTTGEDKDSEEQRGEDAASTASRTAWGTVGSLLLGLGASTLGGLLGARLPTRQRGFLIGRAAARRPPASEEQGGGAILQRRREHGREAPV